MKRILALLVFAATSSFGQTVTPSMTTSQIQSAINSAAVPSTFSFGAGTYNLTAALTMKCGITYTGPVVTRNSLGMAVPTAILTSSTGTIFNFFGQTCSTAGVIQYLAFGNAQESIYIQGPSGNLTIQFNAFNNIIYNGNTTAAIYMDATSQASAIHDVTAQWNTIGDGTSCNGEFGLENSGQCNGVVTFASLTNVYFLHNNFYHVSEGAHFNCPNYGNQQFACEPPGGAITRNLVAQYNDFSNIHRINWEEQPQESSGINFSYNSSHDWLQGDEGSFQISMACCANGAHQTPYVIVADNLGMFNTPNRSGTSRFGYGMEAMGFQSTYSHNMVQSLVLPSYADGIAWGNGGTPQPPNSAFDFTYNNVCGTWTGYPSNLSQYIKNEGVYGDGYTPPTTGSNLQASCSQVASAIPTISPSGGTVSFPLTVTLTDAGYGNTAALARGNTGIWYTTDGSTPVPGSGTAKRVDSGGSIVLLTPGTVKAVGMWGAQNQPAFYPSGFGFSPSSVVTAAFTSGGFFISPTGNDANSGSSGSPWLTPNHAMTCGSTITALPGTYSAANFNVGDWGTVSCPGANNVAWLTCQTFDTCKISSTTSDAMRVDKSFWGVQGWEATTTVTQSGGCFTATTDSGATVHHIIFANNVANGCRGGGFTSYNNGSNGVDYLAIIGNIAYNAAAGNTHCFSGISIYTPVASDSATGTHLYVAGNYSYDNLEPNPCNGTTPTDGEGIIIDTLDGSQGGPQYNQQVAVQNNIVFNNGGMGIEVINNQLQTTPAKIYFKANTAVGDATDNNQTGGCLGRSDVSIKLTKNTTITNNLAQTRAGTSCSSGAIYGSFAETVDSSSTASTNWFYSAAGHPTGIDNGGSFAYTGTTTTNPTLTSTSDPGAPSCTGKTSVVDCMATLIANLAATATGASAFGYQAPSNTSVTDVLFPQWLCAGTGVLNPNIPAGLITPGCGGGVAPTLTGGHQSNATNANTLFVGSAAVQQIAVGTYSDGSNQNLPDSFGNTAVWSSSAPSVLSVGSTGLITCLTSGTGNSQATSSPGGVVFSPWGWTCSIAGLTSGMVCKGGGSPSGGLPGPGGTPPTQGMICHP